MTKEETLLAKVMSKSGKIRALAAETGVDYAIALSVADACHPRNAGKPEGFWHAEARKALTEKAGAAAYDQLVSRIRSVFQASGIV